MGMSLQKCCSDKQPQERVQAPMPIPKKSFSSASHSFSPIKDSKNEQKSLQNIPTLDMVEHEPECITKEEDQFYDIDQIMSQRVKSNPQPKRLCFKDFDICGLLGEGSFGSVMQVQLKQQVERNLDIKYAMKRIPRQKLISHKTLASVKLQRQILGHLSHPFITSLNFAFADKHFIFLVMQLADGGDVGSFVSQGKRINEFRRLGDDGVRFIGACVILGLEYLHSQNILYRDLKAENILLFHDGYAKLSDFGLAKLISHEDEISKTQAGTALYNAPEMVMQLGYNKCVDFWSLGILLYELATGETPFKLEDVSTKLRFKRVAQDEQVKHKWRGYKINSQLQNLIGGLLKFKPQDRLGVKGWHQIKEHVFFAGFDWTSMLNKTLPSPIKSLLTATPSQIKLIKTDDKRRQISSVSDSISDQSIWQFYGQNR